MRLDEVEARARTGAAQRFDAGSNCAQSVGDAVADVLGDETLRIATGAAAGWTGGIGREGCICGALAAGVMLAGMRAERDDPGPRATRAGAEARAVAVKEEFTRQHGGTCCRVIRQGLEFDTPECRTHCRRISSETAAFVARLLAEDDAHRQVRRRDPKDVLEAAAGPVALLAGGALLGLSHLAPALAIPGLALAAAGALRVIRGYRRMSG